MKHPCFRCAYPKLRNAVYDLKIESLDFTDQIVKRPLVFKLQNQTYYWNYERY